MDDIVGQPIKLLAETLSNPKPSCWLLVGDPGTGKTATTRVAANILGCEDDWSGLHHIPCTSLGIEEAKNLFNRDLRLSSCSGWHLVILEECEWLSPQVQRFLKDALDLETNMPAKTIVIGTSNKIDNLDEALVERFRVIQFKSNDEFRVSCMNKIEEKWRYVFEENLPSEAATWGRKGNRFSMRLAIQQAEDALQAKLSTVV
jgi:replication-associated recombination protein RarA